MNQKLCKKHGTLLLCLIILTVWYTPVNAIEHQVAHSILVVNQTNNQGPWDGSWDHPYQTIQDAIYNASGGEDILVLSGTYPEKIHIDKKIHLHGINNPIIYGGYQHSILEINANDIEISNFTIYATGGYDNDSSIYLDSVSNITIENCIFHHARNSIYIQHSNHIQLINNIFSNNGNAILVNQSKNIQLYQCQFSHNAIGLVTKETKNVNLSTSTFLGNGMATLITSSNNLDFYLCNLTDNSVNKGGMFFEESSNISVSYCLFSHNGDGISITASKNINIHHSEFIYNTHFALSLLEPSENIEIKHSIIAHNKRIGIYLERENHCIINNCNIYQNYLNDISGSFFACDAKDNWWGSLLGPFKLNSDILALIFFIHSYPWKTNEIQNIGIQDQPIPACTEYLFEFNQELPIEGVDTDQDQVPDWWEEKWGYSSNEWNDHHHLDPDEDALNNIQECYTDGYGSNPFKKDIFLEIDWMQSTGSKTNKPSQELLDEIKKSFSEQNITLHIDIGNLGQGTEIPNICTKPSGYLSLHNIYWKYFLNNSMKNPRKGIFHYTLICNYCADLNFPFMGWDVFDSSAISAEWLYESFKHFEKEDIIAGAIMHHLGHTLGLTADVFDGIDNVETIQLFSKEWFRYLPYQSCMNYFYKYRILDYSQGTNGPTDFDDWDNIDFSFFQKSTFNR